jgi:NAD-dependent deacetylase
MAELDDAARTLIDEGRHGLVLFLTGAGISAESGIPTFRGPEGYWTEGSRNFEPMSLATQSAFRAMPDTVWAFYLYRRAVCLGAYPNVAHEALVRAERALEERFLVVTQNVDGLHYRVGHDPNRIFAIHGDILRMRCARECTGSTYAIPEAIGVDFAKGHVLTDAERALLVCPACGGGARPHVLWFDETYDEPRFRYESTMRAASRCSLLVVIGTTGATTLPIRVGQAALARRTPIIVINPDPNPFSDMARAGKGAYLSGRASELLPAVVDAVRGARTET